MPGLLPPVIATLIADTKEYMAKMAEAQGQMEEFGAASDTAGAKLTGFASTASTALIGAGAAIVAYGVDKAYDLQEALDKVQNTTNVTAGELDHIKNASLSLSDATTSSAVSIVQAYGAVEAAGYKRAQADKTVAAAAKLAEISGNDVVTTTQALIAAQNLGITSGMSAAKVADTLTIALKGNEQGLSGVVGLLQGKVGAALAAYHQSLGEGVAVANELSQANYTNTRYIASFISKLGEFNTAQTTTTIENGKVRTSTASWVNTLRDAGLNVDQVKTAFTGPDGLVNGLKYLRSAADGSLPRLQEYLTAIFGASGAGAATALINNLDKVSAAVKSTSGASGGGLNKAFATAAGQFGNQLKVIENNLENAAATLGLKLLPDLQKGAKFLSQAMTDLANNSRLRSDLGTGLAVAFAAAVGFKAATMGAGIATAFGLTADSAVAGPLGAAIAVAVLAALKLGGLGNWESLVTGKGEGRGRAVENILENFWNANVGILKDATNLVAPALNPLVNLPTFGTGAPANKKLTVNATLQLHGR